MSVRRVLLEAFECSEGSVFVEYVGSVYVVFLIEVRSRLIRSRIRESVWIVETVVMSKGSCVLERIGIRR